VTVPGKLLYFLVMGKSKEGVGKNYWEVFHFGGKLYKNCKRDLHGGTCKIVGNLGKNSK